MFEWLARALRKAQREGDVCDFSAAMESYDRALRLRPEDAALHMHKALALSGAGRQDEARQAVRQALKAAPKNAVFRTYAGIIALDAGRQAEALEYFREARELDVHYMLPRCCEALVRLTEGHDPEAGQEILALRDHWNHLLEGRILAWSESVLLGANPWPAPCPELEATYSPFVGERRAKKGKRPPARPSIWRRLWAGVRHPTSGRQRRAYLLESEAEQWISVNDIAQARRCYEEIASIFNEPGRTLMALVDLEMMGGNPVKARRMLEKAAGKRAPAELWPDLWWEVAAAHYRQADYRGAHSLFVQLAQRRVQHWAAYGAGLCDLTLGRKRGAANWLASAALCGGAPDAAERLRLALGA